MPATSSTRWFFSDWLSDPALRACSALARGVWKDLLCIAGMNSDGEYGFVLINGQIPSFAVLAKIIGETPAVVECAMAELEANGVCSRTKRGVVYCRRMVRTQKMRENGKLGGNPNLLKDKETPDRVNHMPNLHNHNHNHNHNRLTKQHACKPARKHQSSRVSMPEKWTPDEAGYLYAKDRGFQQPKLGQMVEACRDHHTSRGTLIAGEKGLAATWRTWVNNEIKFAKERSNSNGRHRETFEERSQRLIDKARAVERAAAFGRASDDHGSDRAGDQDAAGFSQPGKSH